jgi:hypothetical protein
MIRENRNRIRGTFQIDLPFHQRSDQCEEVAIVDLISLLCGRECPGKVSTRVEESIVILLH